MLALLLLIGLVHPSFAQDPAPAPAPAPEADPLACLEAI